MLVEAGGVGWLMVGCGRVCNLLYRNHSPRISVMDLIYQTLCRLHKMVSFKGGGNQYILARILFIYLGFYIGSTLYRSYQHQ